MSIVWPRPCVGSHISDITNFLGDRITEIFKMKINVTCNDNTMLKKKRKFVEKQRSVIFFFFFFWSYLVEAGTRSRRKYVAC